MKTLKKLFERQDCRSKLSDSIPQADLPEMLERIRQIILKILKQSLSSDQSKSWGQQLVEPADVQINGTRPWDIQVHNEDFYSRIFTGGTLALGESYMDGWWDAEHLDQFFERVIRADLEEKIKNWVYAALAIRAKLLNPQHSSGAFEVGEVHYDVGNELYERMLGERMLYTCGYWKDAENLDQAQEAKLDLTCRKIGLQPGMRVLDIGCGWSGFGKFAAEAYGAEVVGVTVSKEQVKLAQERCKGLPVETRLQNYEDIDDEKFDRIVSLGMFEHVGYKNYRKFMEVAHRCLEDDGLFLLHTIGNNESTTHTNPWIQKYIFPNAMIPSIAQTGKAAEKLFVVEDWHNFGADYDKTLRLLK